MVVKPMAPVAVAVLALAASHAARAQAETPSPPVGATTWHYECKIGDCPTKCSVGGSDLFTIGGFLTLTIMQLPDRGYWLRIDTSQKSLDYLGRADQFMCSVIGATLTSVRGAESAKPSRP